MRVNVLFFGALSDLAGTRSETVELRENARVEDLFALYEGRIPPLRQWRGAMAMAVNQEYAGPDAVLHDGDEIALLPPVSGGSLRTSLTRTTIATVDVVASIKHPEDGAVVVFEGVVRDNTHGRRTLFLDYHAYEEMARKQLESLADQALQGFAIRDVRVEHRLGKIEIGETSVLIVVASAHRGAAFDACRWMIDTLKRTVPIWKREHFEDGAVWADGEPFPDAIVGREVIDAAAP